MSFLRISVACACVIAVTGCTQFPELDDIETPDLENAAFPTLVPVDTVLGDSLLDGEDSEATTENLQARVAGLQARAARLQRTTVVDDPSRTRMDAARSQ